MTCAKKALGILLVATVGIWGCAQSANPNANQDRLRALELKNAKLEDDFRTAAAVRDQLRRRVATLEEEQRQTRTDLGGQIQGLQHERDAFRQELAARTIERDALYSQFDQFRQGLQNLLGQTEAVLNRSGNSVSNVATEEAN
jgi:hypothetical protein